MSRVLERDSSLFSDIANTTIAGQLESRLKELERNLAVARQFIKLADECYSQVKHEWELLQQDARLQRPETKAQIQETNFEDHEQKPTKELFRFKAKKPRPSDDKTANDSESTLTHAPSLGSKTETLTTKEVASSKQSKHPVKLLKAARSLKTNRKESTSAKE